jgi:hypothetical protein
MHLSVPSIDDLTHVIALSGDESTTVSYERAEDGYVLIDLSSATGKVGYVLLTQKKVLLQLWQIILIVVASVAAIGGTVAAVIIIRKKKTEGYSKHDKI